jgi:hypothetical protein
MLFRAHDPLLHGSVGSQPIPSGSFWERLGICSLPALARACERLALVVDGSGSGYLKTVCDYVLLMPTRARLLAPDQAFRQYQWSGCHHEAREGHEEEPKCRRSLRDLGPSFVVIKSSL